MEASSAAQISQSRTAKTRPAYRMEIQPNVRLPDRRKALSCNQVASARVTMLTGPKLSAGKFNRGFSVTPIDDKTLL
jgi:hypothetical protein